MSMKRPFNKISLFLVVQLVVLCSQMIMAGEFAAALEGEEAAIGRTLEEGMAGHLNPSSEAASVASREALEQEALQSIGNKAEGEIGQLEGQQLEVQNQTLAEEQLQSARFNEQNLEVPQVPAEMQPVPSESSLNKPENLTDSVTNSESLSEVPPSSENLKKDGVSAGAPEGSFRQVTEDYVQAKTEVKLTEARVKEAQSELKSAEQDFNKAQSVHEKTTKELQAKKSANASFEQEEAAFKQSQEALDSARNARMKAREELNAAQENRAQAQEQVTEAKKGFEAQKTRERLKETRAASKDRISSYERQSADLEQQIRGLDEELGFKSKINELEGLSAEEKLIKLREEELSTQTKASKTSEEFRENLQKEGKLTSEEIETRVKKFEDRESLIKQKEALESKIAAEHEMVNYIDDHLGFWNTLGRGVKGFGKFLGDQVGMALIFPLPGEIWRQMQEEQAATALYNTITARAQFGTIIMKVLPGTVMFKDPLSGTFIYADSPWASGLKSQSRRFFMSLNQYQEVGMDYVNSGKVTDVIELKTGAVINGAGVITKVYPLLSSEKESTSSRKELVIQSMLDDKVRSLSGDIRVQKSTLSINPNSMGKHWFSGATDASIQALFVPDSTTHISPLLQQTLDVFKDGINLSEFGIHVQGIAPLGAMTYALSHYADLFETNGTERDLGNNILKGLQNGQRAQIIVQENNPVIPTEKITGNSAGLGVGGDVYDAHLLAQQVYVYQTDSTPAARFIKSIVSPSLKDCVWDYLVAVDIGNNIIPAQVPHINSNKEGAIGAPVVEFVSNKDIAYLVSLVTGATFIPGAQPTLLRTQDGSADYETVTNKVMSNFQSLYGTRRLLLNQIGAMRSFAKNVITQGPFVLRDGLTAHLVKELDLKIDAGIDAAFENTKNVQELGKAGQSEKDQKSSGMNVSDKREVLKSLYIYRIDNALSSPEGAHTLPDYVIPVTINHATGNYLNVSLGSQAEVSSGMSLPHISSKVTALISLVTSKVYDPTYNLFPKSVVTDLVVADAAGKPRPCASNPARCSNGYEIQDGGKAVPLATAFVESDLNPINSTRSQADVVKMSPFHFLTLRYDYTVQSVTDQATQGAFVSSVNQKNIKTLPVSLLEILPVALTGITSPETEDMAALEKALAQEGKVAQDTQKENYTFTQVHTLWRQALLKDTQTPEKKWSMILSEGPHDFTAQGWSIAADQSSLTEDLFLYTVTSPVGMPLQGWWVAGKLGASALSISELPSSLRYATGSEFMSTARAVGMPALADGKTFEVLIAQQEILLSALTDLGTNFVNNKSLNLLVNIGTGSVLVRCFDKTTNTERVIPIVNFRGQAYTFNPVNVIESVLKNVGRKVLPDGLQVRVDTLQDGKTADKMGPFVFGPFMMFIERKDSNNGNYIYQAYNGTLNNPDVYDYFVATDGDMVNFPLSNTTRSILSFVSSIQYTRSGSENAFVGADGSMQTYADQILPLDKSKMTLLGFDRQMVDYITKASGSPVRAELQSALSAANKKYVDGQLAQLEKEKTQESGQKSYQQKVFEALQSGANDYKFPNISQLKPVQGSRGMYYDSATQQFFLKEIRPEDIDQSAQKTDEPVNYYAFNIAKSSDALINQVPTGLHCKIGSNGKMIPQSVLGSGTARAMALAQGIIVSDDGSTQTKAFPVARTALSMSSDDKSLGGGKNGKFMQLVDTEQGLKTSTGVAYYLYKNIVNFETPTTKDLTPKDMKIVDQKRPSDILLQINRANGSYSYLSLVTGFEYSADGQPASTQTDTYLPLGKDGTPLMTAPLTVWGNSDGQMRLVVPVSGSFTDASSLVFNEFITQSGRVSYQYSDATKTYNLTYLNPQTYKIDGSVYAVDPKAPNQILKTWNETVPAQTITDPETNAQMSVDTLDTRMSTNFAKATNDLKKEGMKLSQKIYRMSNVTSASSLVTLDAYYNVGKDEWTLYQDEQSLIGSFKPVVTKTGESFVSSYVLSHLGVAKSQGNQALSFVEDSIADSEFLRSIAYVDNRDNSSTKGKITGVMYRGKYFGFDAKTGADYKNRTASLSVVQAVSPLLQCRAESAALSSIPGCATASSSGTQYPNDINYMIMYDHELTKQQVYGYEYPSTVTADVAKLLQVLKLKLVISNEGGLTLVKQVNSSSLQKVDLSALKQGDSDYSQYKASALDTIKNFYDKAIAQVQKNKAQTINALQTNSASQQATPDQALQKQTAVLQQQAYANGAEVEKSLQEQSGQALNELTQKCNALEKAVNRLRFDSATGTLLYVLSSDETYGDSLKEGYVSYSTDSSPGGILYDTNGVPTGDVLDAMTMRGIERKLGGITVSATKPALLLAVPALIPAFAERN